MSNEAIMIVHPASARRFIALGVLGILGLLLIYLGFSAQGQFIGRVFLVLVGGICVWATSRMYAATSNSLILTSEGLSESSGEILARMEDIDKVERGTFAFKPSNGFLVFLKTPSQRAWRPGLWWRFGKRIGIGGVTNVGQNKAMAELLQAELRKRDNDTSGMPMTSELVRKALKKRED